MRRTAFLPLFPGIVAEESCVSAFLHGALNHWSRATDRRARMMDSEAEECESHGHRYYIANDRMNDTEFGFCAPANCSEEELSELAACRIFTCDYKSTSARRLVKSRYRHDFSSWGMGKTLGAFSLLGRAFLARWKFLSTDRVSLKRCRQSQSSCHIQLV